VSRLRHCLRVSLFWVTARLPLRITTIPHAALRRPEQYIHTDLGSAQAANTASAVVSYTRLKEHQQKPF